MCIRDSFVTSISPAGWHICYNYFLTRLRFWIRHSAILSDRSPVLAEVGQAALIEIYITGCINILTSARAIVALIGGQSNNGSGAGKDRCV